jgi:hypothetical protein
MQFIPFRFIQEPMHRTADKCRVQPKSRTSFRTSNNYSIVELFEHEPVYSYPIIKSRQQVKQNTYTKTTMKSIILFVILSLVVTIAYGLQTSKTYNHVLLRRGAETITWGRGSNFQEYHYFDYGLDPIPSYNGIFSDSRQDYCVYAVNHADVVIATKELVRIKRIYADIRSYGAYPCKLKIAVSSDAYSKADTTTILDITNYSVLGKVEFSPSQVNLQNGRYRYFAFYATSSNNNEPCSICALEMFSG